MRGIRLLALGLCLIVASCTTTETDSDRQKLDDFEGQTFIRLDDALGFAGCEWMENAVWLSTGDAPALDAQSALAYAKRNVPTNWESGFGPIQSVGEVPHGIWLFAAEEGIVVGGVQQSQQTHSYCIAPS